MSRGGYSGSATVTITVERVIDSETQKLRLPNDDDEETSIGEFEVLISGNAHYSPGRTSGHPDSWYESDEDCEIEDAVVNSEPFIGADIDLTKKEEEQALEKLIESIKNDY